MMTMRDEPDTNLQVNLFVMISTTLVLLSQQVQEHFPPDRVSPEVTTAQRRDTQFKLI
jgi:hypothetical protein